MAPRRIAQVRGRAVAIPGDDLDTDRIVPARFLKSITFTSLGDALFHDERFGPDGAPKGHPLDDPARKGARVMLGGVNFGCGSSREHAPQAIRRAGFDAVVAGSFAEIFFGNATAIGLVCASVAPAPLTELCELVAAHPETELVVDVERLEVRAAGRTYLVEVRSSARQALLSGRWDPLGELLEGIPEVRAVAARLGHVPR